MMAHLKESEKCKVKVANWERNRRTFHIYRTDIKFSQFSLSNAFFLLV